MDERMDEIGFKLSVYDVSCLSRNCNILRQCWRIPSNRIRNTCTVTTNVSCDETSSSSTASNRKLSSLIATTVNFDFSLFLCLFAFGASYRNSRTLNMHSYQSSLMWKRIQKYWNTSYCSYFLNDVYHPRNKTISWSFSSWLISCNSFC